MHGLPSNGETHISQLQIMKHTFGRKLKGIKRTDNRMRRRDLEELGEECAKQRRQWVQHEAKYHEVFNVWNPDVLFPLHPCVHKCWQVEVLFYVSSE